MNDHITALTKKRHRFVLNLRQTRDESQRLFLIHQQIAWCRMNTKNSDSVTRQYCHNWLKVLCDGLASVA